MKIGDKVTSVHVRIDTALNVQEIKKEEHTVIGTSKYYIQLDGDFFPKIDVEKDYAKRASIENVVIFEETSSDSIIINLLGKFKIQIFSQMSDECIQDKLNLEFQKWLNEKMGKYGAAKQVDIWLPGVKR